MRDIDWGASKSLYSLPFFVHQRLRRQEKVVPLLYSQFFYPGNRGAISTVISTVPSAPGENAPSAEGHGIRSLRSSVEVVAKREDTRAVMYQGQSGDAQGHPSGEVETAEGEQHTDEVEPLKQESPSDTGDEIQWGQGQGHSPT
ncbi:MAG: hypothetical protein GX030_08775 [Firmicutes bacterium]|nr:hypothetical protein [Bacillota bacterium]